MKKHRIGLLLGLMLCLLLSSAFAEGITRAVLVGIGRFAFQPELSIAAETNVTELAQTLKSMKEAPRLTLAYGSGAAEDQASVYRSKIHTPEALEQLLEEGFGDADEEDVLLLYLCTHGVNEPDGDCGLLLSDGETDTLLTAERLAAMLERYPGQKLLILDACYSGAMVGCGLGEEGGDHPFGSDVSVLASCGGLEKSWYWLNDASTQGSFYFTAQLCNGLDAASGSPADADRDGSITLTELYRYLLENHGISTPVLVLSQSDDTTFTPARKREVLSPLRELVFSSSYTKDGRLSLTMTAYRPVSLAYRTAAWDENGWDFSEATVLYDEAEEDTASPYAGAVNAGAICREFDFSGTEGGYVLLQVVANEEGKLLFPASHVIALLSEKCEVTATAKLLADGRLRLFLAHEKPVLFTVWLADEEHEERVLTRTASRPSLCGGDEYFFSPEGFCGEVSFRIECGFANEKTETLSNAVNLP